MWLIIVKVNVKFSLYLSDIKTFPRIKQETAKSKTDNKSFNHDTIKKKSKLIPY